VKTTATSIVTSQEDASPLAFANGVARILGSTATTNGAFSIVHLVQGHGIATPLHIHHTSDEAFFILAGEAHGVLGDEEWHAGPGSFVWLPRGVPHAFQTVSADALELLTMSIPGAFDNFVVAASEPYVEGMDLAAAMPDPRRLAALAAQNEIATIGPPVNFL
jgi:mannose-6-phosphate isomerase-like protein (cupin superfamily)